MFFLLLLNRVFSNNPVIWIFSILLICLAVFLRKFYKKLLRAGKSLKLWRLLCFIPLVLALIIFGTWNILPFTIIILLSSMQNINETYYTVARVDEAKPMRIFFRITVPLLSPTIFLVSIVNTIS